MGPMLVHPPFFKLNQSLPGIAPLALKKWAEHFEGASLDSHVSRQVRAPIWEMSDAKESHSGPEPPATNWHLPQPCRAAAVGVRTRPHRDLHKSRQQNAKSRVSTLETKVRLPCVISRIRTSARSSFLDNPHTAFGPAV